jgi:hypothetical protein
MLSWTAREGRAMISGSWSACAEGWDTEGRVYNVSEVVRRARAWMSRRAGADMPAVSGMSKLTRH